MRIAVVDSFFDTSHRQWAEGLQRYSGYDIDIFKGSPHHWKWKMEGGAIELADKINTSKIDYDLFLVTDMVHLPHFRSLLDKRHIDVPTIMYFHENQITYPWSEQDRDTTERVDRHYGWINYISACQADRILFNSEYHKRSFLSAIPKFIKPFPKFPWKEDYKRIQSISEVLPIGLELPDYGVAKEKPTFLWNHRWEYDKNPAEYFEILIELKDRGIDFDLIVLGKQYGNSPTVFKKAMTELEVHITHWGWVDNRLEYYNLLRQANIQFVTSQQDFFGISIVEAIAAGAYPLLPNRLAYPEHLPKSQRSFCLYDDKDEAIAKLCELINDKRYIDTTIFRKKVEKYDWNNIIELYDSFFDTID